MKRKQALVVDDDPAVSHLIDVCLRDAEWQVAKCFDGASAAKWLGANSVDLIMLDVLLPDVSGTELCRRIRDLSDGSIIVVSAVDDSREKVRFLSAGADDYIPKPFGPRELLARLRAVLRRVQPEFETERLSSGGLVVEVEARSVRAEGNPVEVTGVEFDLLVALLRRAVRVVPRASLLELAGRSDVVVSERTVDVHVSHLRRKLGPAGGRIKTVRGVGYVLGKDA